MYDDVYVSMSMMHRDIKIKLLLNDTQYQSGNAICIHDDDDCKDLLPRFE